MYQRRSFSKQTGEGEANTCSIGRLSFGHSSCKGHRPTMEDEICAKLEMPGLPGSGFFGVFDGHGGPQVARYAAQAIPTRLFSKLRPSGKGPARSTRAPEGARLPDTLPGLNSHSKLPGLFNHDEQPKSGGMAVASWPPRPTDSANKNIHKLLRESFLEADNQMLNATTSKHCGTTACCVMVTSDYFVFANLGDSRAILASNDEVVFSTKDHKPGDQRERKRIYDAGGFVLRGRICGSLAVARALGDHSFKSATIPQPAQMVSPEPDTCYVDRNHQLDEFLVIACDGVFDVMSNEAVADVVRESMRHFNSLTVVASQLVEQALQRGSSDNISAMIVTFVDGSVQHHGKHTGRRSSVSPVAPPGVPGSLPPLLRQSPASTTATRQSHGLPTGYGGGGVLEDPEDMVESGASESDWGSDEDDTVSEGGSPSPRQPRQRSNSVMLDENPLEAAEAFPPTI